MIINVNPYFKSNIAGLLELATIIHACARSTHHGLSAASLFF